MVNEAVLKIGASSALTATGRWQGAVALATTEPALHGDRPTARYQDAAMGLCRSTESTYLPQSEGLT